MLVQGTALSQFFKAALPPLPTLTDVQSHERSNLSRGIRRAQSSYNNSDWQALRPHQVTEAIYRELRAIDAERNQNPRRALVEPMVKECPGDQSVGALCFALGMLFGSAFTTDMEQQHEAADYLDAARHGTDESGALFRVVRNNRTGRLERAITGDGIYRLARAYSALLGFEIGAYALDHQADMAKVQEWLGHANISTTRIYDHRRTRPEDSPTFKVAY